MPWFETDNLNISPDEYLAECSERDKRALIDILKEDGYIYIIEAKAQNLLDEEWNTAISVLANSRLRMSSEDEKALLKLYLKYS